LRVRTRSTAAPFDATVKQTERAGTSSEGRLSDSGTSSCRDPCYTRREPRSEPIGAEKLEEAANRAGRVAALDGLRGAAIALVLVYHSLLLPAAPSIVDRVYARVAGLGWSGVDLFFVLSGFLVTGILEDSRRGIDFRSFYARRVLRIFPAYYAFLLLRLLLMRTGTLPQLPALDGRDVFYLFSYLTNVAIAFHLSTPEAYTFDLGIFWSLAVEEQFYLLWPLLAWGLSPRGFRKVVCALFLTAVACRIALLHFGYGFAAAYMLTPCRMDALGAGALVALLVREPIDEKRLLRGARAVLAASTTGLSAIVLATRSPSAATWPMESVGYSLFAAAYASVLTLLVAGARGRAIVRVFRHPLLVALGRKSYAMYLVHATIVAESAQWFRAHDEALSVGASRLPGQLAFTVFVFLASYAAAAVSWHAVEKHCLSLKRRFPLPRLEGEPRRSASLKGSWGWPAGATVSLVALALVVSLALRSLGMGDAPPLHASPGGRAVNLRFDRPLPGTGWYPPDALPGGYAAWTSAPRSTIRMRLEPGCSYRLRFHVLAAITPEVASSLRAGFDETEIPLRATRDGAGGVSYEGVIPRSAITSEGSVFLSVAAVKTPTTLAPGDDPRPRGVMVDALRVEPIAP
jgi:peptidoglycan/LPS O-acetylase OafA/YrhL